MKLKILIGILVFSSFFLLGCPEPPTERCVEVQEWGEPITCEMRTVNPDGSFADVYAPTEEMVAHPFTRCSQYARCEIVSSGCEAITDSEYNDCFQYCSPKSIDRNMDKCYEVMQEM